MTESLSEARARSESSGRTRSMSCYSCMDAPNDICTSALSQKFGNNIGNGDACSHYRDGPTLVLRMFRKGKDTASIAGELQLREGLIDRWLGVARARERWQWEQKK